MLSNKLLIISYLSSNLHIFKFIHLLNTYLGWKEEALNPEPQSKNLRSLTQLKYEFFTYYQESSGEDVEYFWKKIEKRQLNYKRENKLLKILERQRIKDQHEYDYITDVIVPYQQEGLINDEEVRNLNQFLSDYELSPKRR